jgi:hypothetical protein
MVAETNKRNIEVKPAPRDREYESRELDDFREEDLLGATALNLSGPPARKGYVQKWVRVYLDGSEDDKNIRKAEKLKWTPRTGEDGQPIRVGTSVLMERPKKFSEIRQRKIKEKNERYMNAIIKQSNRALPLDRGFGPVFVDNDTKTIIERR